MTADPKQEMITWPIMMDAVPWPMEERVGHYAHGRQQQQQESLHVHHLGHQQGQHAYLQVSPQDNFLVATSGKASDAGACLSGPAMQQQEKQALQHQQQQRVQYPQMVQYMLMHMEGLMPASGNQIDSSSLLQIQAMQAMWPDSDEVYME